MKRYLLSAVAAALTGVVPVAGSAATPPIVSVACTSAVTGCAFAADGQFPVQGQQWQTDTAWWTGLTQSVVYSLSSPLVVTGFTGSLDNNDTYLFETSLDGANWTGLTQVASDLGEIGAGMDTFSTDASNPEFVSGIGFSPTLASFVRIAATSGDDLYSVGELTLITSVPEPSTFALAASGIAALSMARRQKRRDAEEVRR